MRMDVFLGAVCDAVWWAASRLTHSTPQRRGPDRTTGIGMCAWCCHARGLATAYVPLELSVDGGPYRTEYLFPSQHAGDTFTERGAVSSFQFRDGACWTKLGPQFEAWFLDVRVGAV